MIYLLRNYILALYFIHSLSNEKVLLGHSDRFECGKISNHHGSCFFGQLFRLWMKASGCSSSSLHSQASIATELYSYCWRWKLGVPIHGNVSLQNKHTGPVSQITEWSRWAVSRDVLFAKNGVKMDRISTLTLFVFLKTEKVTNNPFFHMTWSK